MSTTVAVAHIKARYDEGGFMLERCEDPGCSVGDDGRADCGRLACPACGTGGSNLIGGVEGPVSCSCGHIWVA
jgi:hypothetical protein